MLFVPDGPDIPQSLLSEQRNGNLMFMIGAGVSVAAGLPLFGRLAELAYERLGQAIPGKPDSLATQAEVEALAAGQYDRLIGLLERRLVYRGADWQQRSEEHTSELQSLMRISYAVFCLQQKPTNRVIIG